MHNLELYKKTLQHYNAQHKTNRQAVELIIKLIN